MLLNVAMKQTIQKVNEEREKNIKSNMQANVNTILFTNITSLVWKETKY